MDDLLREFLTETAESLDVVDVELVKFEQEPNNADILDNIFRLVHTIKGTCGFLGLPRLEALAHAAETLMGKFRDGASVTQDAVSLILVSIDRIKEILAELEAQEAEPEGSDSDLIDQLHAMAEGAAAAPAEEVEHLKPGDFDAELGRELRPGEVSMAELEAAFQAAEGPAEEPAAEAAAEQAPEATAEAAPEPAPEPAKPVEAKAKAGAEGGQAKEVSIANQSIRVNVDTIETLMTMVSELVLTRNQLLEMVRRMDDSEFKVPLQRLSNVTAELQEGVMKTRMQPIGNAWQKLPRIVRDLSKELNKKIDLEMIGADTELDRQVLEMIRDPLTHMVRNSADHGLETTADRLAKGKPEVGKIVLRAYHEGGHIIIEIADDGQGLNTEKIIEKALKNGLTTEAEVEKMTEQQVHRFIFAPGFSTAAQVTNVSGRGVGMDVVRSNIEVIGGSVDLKSVEGNGTTFTIKIPLTLAIVSALIVQSADQRFAIPQLSVVELVRAKDDSEHRIEQINDTPVLRLRNRLLPLINLDKVLNIATKGEAADGESEAAETTNDEAFIVVVQVGSNTFGIVVDNVFDTEEIVVKPLASILRDVNLFSGNTILGDGSVIMIVDPTGVANLVTAEAAETQTSTDKAAALDTQGVEKTSLLIFRAGGSEPKAVPLSLVTRLEEFDVEAVEQSNGRNMVQYRGKLMPLVHVDPAGRFKETGRQPVLVFTEDNRSMGLVVDEIVDIVEDTLKVEIRAETPGMLGSAIIKEKATEILDVGHFLTQAYADWFERAAQKEDDLGLGGRRVLLVDDSAFFRNMLAPLLSVSGYEVTAVSSPAEALALKENGQSFDIIVSDIEMPEMDGFAFAEALRADERWNNVPLVALSSRSDPEDMEKGIAAGFKDYVAKYDRERLVEVLNATLANYGDAA